MAEQLTAFEKEQLRCATKIQEYKLTSEANIVASIYKNPELIYNTDIKLEDFSNNIWKCYFAIAVGILITEKKNSVDEITFGIYLEKHKKLKAKVDEYGGYDTIKSATAYIKLDNFDSYVAELKKYNVLLELLKYGFPIGEERLSSYVDKTCDQIYDELEMMLNHTFINVESNIKSYNGFDDINKYIDELNMGADIGMPLHNAELLNGELGGIHEGHIIGIGAASGVGKSWLTFNYVVPSCIKYNEPVVFIINEESEQRIKKELLIWVANHEFKADLNKFVLRNGHFDSKVMELLRKCAKWIEEQKDKHLLTIVPLTTYNAETAIKIINKYSSAMGVKYFVLDTLKESANAKDETWRSMVRDTVKLYDTIKPANKNVALILTYQLNKASLKMRKLTSAEIGSAKSIIDVFSANVMVRKPNNDEYAGQSKALKCFRLDGKNKVSFELEEDKNYLIIFITKNRWGRADQYEIIAEVDYGKNTYKEIGYTMIMEDW